jgi:hypothetical protein
MVVVSSLAFSFSSRVESLLFALGALGLETSVIHLPPNASKAAAARHWPHRRVPCEIFVVFRGGSTSLRREIVAGQGRKSEGANSSETAARVRMSALGQKRTFAPQYAMSALPPKADVKRPATLEEVTGRSG